MRGGRSRGGACGQGYSLILGKKETTGERKADMANKTKPPPPLGQGLDTPLMRTQVHNRFDYSKAR